MGHVMIYLKTRGWMIGINHPLIEVKCIAVVEDATENSASLEWPGEPVETCDFTSKNAKVPRDGIEPTAPAFSVLCSTN